MFARRRHSVVLFSKNTPIFIYIFQNIDDNVSQIRPGKSNTTAAVSATSVTSFQSGCRMLKDDMIE